MGRFQGERVGFSTSRHFCPRLHPRPPAPEEPPLTSINFFPHLQPLEGRKEEFLLCLQDATTPGGRRGGEGEEGSPNWGLDKGQRP